MARAKAFDEDRALDAAVDCFWLRGYEGTSVRDLTAAMGIGGPSLYNAYGDKRELFERALRRYAERSMRERITRLEATHQPKEAINAFVGEIRSFFRRNIDAARKAGQVPHRTDAEAMSGHLLGVVTGIRVLARTGSDRKLLESVARPALELLEGGR